MKIFELTKSFPVEERYSLTDQIRRSSRSVCANLTEAWRKRKYPKAFTSKVLDSEGEAAETQNWLDFAKQCGYINEMEHEKLFHEYDNILGKLVNIRRTPEKWSR